MWGRKCEQDMLSGLDGAPTWHCTELPSSIAIALQAQVNQSRCCVQGPPVYAKYSWNTRRRSDIAWKNSMRLKRWWPMSTSKGCLRVCVAKLCQKCHRTESWHVTWVQSHHKVTDKLHPHLSPCVGFWIPHTFPLVMLFSLEENVSSLVYNPYIWSARLIS